MGMVCCTEFENGKGREGVKAPGAPCDPDCKDAAFKEPKAPAAADAAASDAQDQAGKEAAEEAEFEQKMLKAAEKIQANFRGSKARTSVTQMRENTVVQHYEDPELVAVNPESIQLQSRPNRMSVSSGGDISPRTLAAFGQTKPPWMR
mmetsp:Transcript_45559/g.102514  ORF Transcript_45559/g.102514 Transcript_45559/m.102514 type:complete len:148 (-) Transcript_45559:366-809(-)